MSDLVATTKVRIELEGRTATIADLQAALDTFKREGIPETFEVSFHQFEERDNSDSAVPYAQRQVTRRMWLESERAAVTS